MDIWSKQKRSEVMSKIRGKDTKPEIMLRSELFRLGFRYRLHPKHLPGKPDIVLTKHKTVIFVHGCFWHFHKNCNEGRIPSTNSKFWNEKLQRNIIRDEANIRELQKNNWQVLVIWECEIEKQFEQTIKKLTAKLK